MFRRFAAALLALVALLIVPVTAHAKPDKVAEGVPVRVIVLDIDRKPISTAVVRHPQEADRHRVNSVDGSWEASVLYMPDGGIHEDFLHIAGLVQVSVESGTMRPFLVVGIENTERRRDMTGPTDNESDKKSAPQAAG